MMMMLVLRHDAQGGGSVVGGGGGEKVLYTDLFAGASLSFLLPSFFLIPVQQAIYNINPRYFPISLLFLSFFLSFLNTSDLSSSHATICLAAPSIYIYPLLYNLPSIYHIFLSSSYTNDDGFPTNQTSCRRG